MNGREFLDSLLADLANEGEPVPGVVGELDLVWWFGRAPGEGCELQEPHWQVEVFVARGSVHATLAYCSDALTVQIADALLDLASVDALTARWLEVFHVEYDGELDEVAA